MIKVESVHIQEFRGIRELLLDFSGKSYGISGPNGSGKSGVVDAIEFGLTGNISRLTGEGTDGVSIAKHAPHVDVGEGSSKSIVTITGKIPGNTETITIKRSVAKPKEPIIAPDNADIKAAFEGIQQHPEFVLSRREIVKYIITPAGQRDTDVKTLLRLERLEKIRKAMTSLDNKKRRDAVMTARVSSEAVDELKVALGVDDLKSDEFLAKINHNRTILGLVKFDEISPEKAFRDDIVKSDVHKPAAKILKAVAMAEVSDFIAKGEAELDELKVARESAKATLESLAEDMSAVTAVRRLSLIDTGLVLIEDNICPLCDTDWAAKDLAEYLKSKLNNAKAAQEALIVLEQKLDPLIKGLEFHKGYLVKSAKLYEVLHSGQEDKHFNVELETTKDICTALNSALEDGASMQKAIDLLSAPLCVYTQTTKGLLADLQKSIEEMPDESKTDSAKELLIVAQERYNRVVSTELAEQIANADHKVTSAVLNHFNDVATSMLDSIYETVESDFSEFYQILNSGDEDDFEGKLTLEAAKLNLNVDFYGRGIFPPGAFHSEGHQDGMGLCLYLALMKQTMGDFFGFCVLDDVLMSVDSGHRRQVCQLLKSKFPNTQFVLTTHDRVWLQFMKTEQLIQRSQTFGGWSVDAGPVVYEDQDIWTGIDESLSKGDVSTAAARLRRFLEYISHFLCDSSDASVLYRANGQYTLGDLFPSTMRRIREILIKSEQAAISYGNNGLAKDILDFRKNYQKVLSGSRTEEWAVNPSVHYNEWANLSVKEFKDVATAYEELMLILKCETCDTFLYLSYASGKAVSFGCHCGGKSFGLLKKT